MIQIGTSDPPKFLNWPQIGGETVRFIIMARRKTYLVAGQEFRTKKELRQHIRNILYSYPLGSKLNQVDFEFMRDLLNWHTRAEQKIGCGVAYMYVKANPVFRNNQGFWLVREDGTQTDFSFEECLRNTTPLQQFKKGCRTAVKDVVAQFRRDFFSDKDIASCPFTGEEFTMPNSHVDHAPPNTFNVIVNTFIDEYKVDVKKVELIGPGHDNVIRNVIADESLRKAFVDFHNSLAELRVISQQANLSLVKRGKAMLADTDVKTNTELQSNSKQPQQMRLL